ncbi:MAG: YceI family protein, partial [Microthrixaceae bacterium]
MSNRTKGIIGASVVVVLLVGVGAWYLLFRDDAPAEVSLESATEQVPESTQSDSSTDATTGTTDGISGTWTVDTESGSFDFESADGSFAGFRVQEELVSIGGTEAVGRTGEVTGNITIEGTTLTSAEITVDMASITTDQPRRDGRVRDALKVEQFPTATFTLTEPVDLGAGAESGEAVAVEANGQMTIAGVTQDTTATIEAQLESGTAVVVGTVPFTFADYQVEKP